MTRTGGIVQRVTEWEKFDMADVVTDVEEDDNGTSGIRIFVYGTLKAGGVNSLGKYPTAHFLGRTVLTGRYRMLDMGWYPGLVRSPDLPVEHILGEVWRADRSILDMCDIIEGHPNFYARSKITTPWKAAWCYFLPSEWADKRPLVSPGIWAPTFGEDAYLEEYVKGYTADE